MRLTIIVVDNAVYVDGECRAPLELSQCNIPSNVHAVQWFDTKGWIEFNDDGDPFTPIPANEYIEVLPEWVSAAVTLWQNWTPPAPPELPVGEQ